MNKFEALGIEPNIVKAITEMGFETPTPIQEQAIPVLLKEEKDLVGLAQTGTGKTAAFGIPLIQTVDFNSRNTQALILCPTRELCLQITKDLQSYTKYTQGANIVAIYGGASIVNQLRDVKRGAQIVVGTPGRMVDMINRKGVTLSTVIRVVLDEADEMLNMGFKEDLDMILSETPDQKCTWLFSATMPREVETIARKYMSDPFQITVGKRNEGNVNIEHVYYVVQSRDRYAALKRIVDFYPEIFGIVFCRTKAETQEVAEKLIRDGYNADALHGDLSQAQRDQVMKRYRSRSLQVLVATDVAARGIDVDDVTHVINYNLPDEIENYTHRSGRTARAGKTGISIVILNIREVGKIRMLEKIIGKKFTKAKVPGGSEVCEKQLFALISKIHDVEVNEAAIEQYLPGIYAQLEDLTKEELIKRFVSDEFNRFLEYYKNAPDLNVENRGLERPERTSDRFNQRGDDRREERSSERSGEPRTRVPDRDANMTRFFINVGEMDGLDKGGLLRFICDTSNLEGSNIGRIDIKSSFSFFDAAKEVEDFLINAFKDQNFKGRSVRIDPSNGPGAGGGAPRENSFGRGKRPYSGGGSGGDSSWKKKSYGGNSGGGYADGNSTGGYKKRSYGSDERPERPERPATDGNTFSDRKSKFGKRS
jgi:ATP-dependent RNA helicase DeaD